MADGLDGSDLIGPEDRQQRQLDAVYRAQAPGLARYLRSRFGGAADVDDMVQDVFARLAGGKRVVELGNPEAYLRRILRNLLIDRKRRADTRPAFVELESAEPVVEPEQSHAIDVTQMQERYRASVNSLPPRTREVFLLHRAEDTSVKEIAARLGISTRTVEWHLAQAILRIREALEQE